MNVAKGMCLRHPELNIVEVIGVTYHSSRFGGADVAEVWPIGVHARQNDAKWVLLSDLTPIAWDEGHMRSLAARWISPFDVELTRFATGHDRNPGSTVDWPEFIAECELNQRVYANKTPEDRHELSMLIHYARYQILEGTR